MKCKRKKEISKISILESRLLIFKLTFYSCFKILTPWLLLPSGFWASLGFIQTKRKKTNEYKKNYRSNIYATFKIVLGIVRIIVGYVRKKIIFSIHELHQ